MTRARQCPKLMSQVYIANTRNCERFQLEQDHLSLRACCQCRYTAHDFIFCEISFQNFHLGVSETSRQPSPVSIEMHVERKEKKGGRMNKCLCVITATAAT